jgi:uncharacterized protein (DUF1800 family)
MAIASAFGIGRWSGESAGKRVPIEFPTTTVRVLAGDTHTLPVTLLASSFAPQEFPTSSEDEAVISIKEPARVLARQTVGFYRIMALKPGRSRVNVAGQDVLIEAVPAPVDPRCPLAIAGPAPDSCVWGKFLIAVDAPPGGEVPELTLPDGREMKPSEDPVVLSREAARFIYEVDADTLEPGQRTFRASIKSGASAMVTLFVVRPKAAELWAGETEDHQVCLLPERFKGRAPKVAKDEEASGGERTEMPSENPPWSCAFEIPAEGHYQLIMRVKGEAAAGAFPSAGLMVNNENDPVASARALSAHWHRIPVGRPIRLEPGQQTLSLSFINDFAANARGRRGIDRNLALDAYELARVDSLLAGEAFRRARQEKAMTIAFDRAFDGEPVTGAVILQGKLQYDGRVLKSAPVTSLWINGNEVASTQATAPRFHVHPWAFSEGVNQVQLRSVSNAGAVAESPVQTLTLARPIRAAHANPIVDLFFVAQDDRWDEAFQKCVFDLDGKKGERAARLSADGEVALALPASLAAGRYRLAMDAKGESFKGPPQCKVELAELGGGRKLIRELKVEGDFSWREAGEVELSERPSSLVLAFTNDLYDAGKGDRNLVIRALRISPIPDEDLVAPMVAIKYPSRGHDVHGMDVVVVEALDDRKVAAADLLIDGEPQSIETAPSRGMGRIVLPLVARGLEPGWHDIAARVRDAAGNHFDTPAVRVRVLAEAPPFPGRYGRAIHLLKRFGFGRDDRDLADVLLMGEQAWLRDRLARPATAPGEQTAALAARAEFPNSRDEYQVTARVIDHALRTDNPIRMRFVLWVHNHFSTWVRKTGALAKAAEHDDFLRLGCAPFPQLLNASARSPAMLVYLDQQRSYGGRINENYARELMELHTVGVDAGYTQRDVTNLAKVLTGWMTTAEAPMDGAGGSNNLDARFHFEPQLNDSEEEQVFGMLLAEASEEKSYDRPRMVLEMLARHPATAKFICRKLAEHYVAIPAPEDLVAAMAVTFNQTGGDMVEVMIAMSRHRDFWDEGLQPKLSTPIHFAIGLARASGDANPHRILDFLKRSSANLFDRETPDGYPEEPDHYANSNAMLQRWRFAKELEESLLRLVPQPWKKPDLEFTDAIAQRIIDVCSNRLIGQNLGDRSNQAALQIAMANAQANSRDRVQALVTFITQLPEVQMQ